MRVYGCRSAPHRILGVTVIILDAFCAGGAASDGYRRQFPHAQIVGVDIDPQPYYPYDFVQADALTFDLAGFDLKHASPPCQGYSTGVSSTDSKWVPTRGKNEPRLIAPMRERFTQSGGSWVIENVAGARNELINPVCLCGSMFGLDIPRHRYFESSFPIAQPTHINCRGIAKKAAARRGWEYRDMSVTGKGRHAGTSARWAELLGMGRVMRQHDYAEAIPPAYTEFIGLNLARTL